MGQLLLLFPSAPYRSFFVISSSFFALLKKQSLKMILKSSFEKQANVSTVCTRFPQAKYSAPYLFADFTPPNKRGKNT